VYIVLARDGPAKHNEFNHVGNPANPAGGSITYIAGIQLQACSVLCWEARNTVLHQQQVLLWIEYVVLLRVLGPVLKQRCKPRPIVFLLQEAYLNMSGVRLSLPVSMHFLLNCTMYVSYAGTGIASLASAGIGPCYASHMFSPCLLVTRASWFLMA
jgi:hypothetical protein